MYPVHVVVYCFGSGAFGIKYYQYVVDISCVKDYGFSI